MNISSIPLATQTTLSGEKNNESEAKKNTNSTPGKRQYITIRDGDYNYTYVVIGDNFRVLIGRVAVDKDEDKDKDKGNDKLKKEETDKIEVPSMFNHNQTLIKYQQLGIDIPTKNNIQGKIQAMEESAVNSNQNDPMFDAKG